MSNNNIEIAVDIKHITDAAVLVSDGDKQVWIPKGQIEDYTDELIIGHSITIFIPEWLATNKGLI